MGSDSNGTYLRENPPVMLAYASIQNQRWFNPLTLLARQEPLCDLLMSIPGIGVINASALYSAIGNGSQFRNGREFAVWLGLTPRQSSSGNKLTRGGITKRGNKYLRKQLIHGARAMLYRARKKTDRLSQWGSQLLLLAEE